MSPADENRLMEEYFRQMLEESGDLDGEFGQTLQSQLAFLGLDLDWLLNLAAAGMALQATPIPPLLHSLFDGPFEQCLMCQGKLLAPPTEYLIVRMFRHDEPIVEYALCIPCHERQWESYSAETRARLMADVPADTADSEVDFSSEAAAEVDSDFERRIAHCRSTGTPRGECDVYQVTAVCTGPCLALWSSGPWMRSGESLRESWKLWSPESRGHYDDFVEEFLGPTPSLAREIPRPLTANPPPARPTAPLVKGI